MSRDSSASASRLPTFRRFATVAPPPNPARYARRAHARRISRARTRNRVLDHEYSSTRSRVYASERKPQGRSLGTEGPRRHSLDLRRGLVQGLGGRRGAKPSWANRAPLGKFSRRRSRLRSSALRGPASALWSPPPGGRG